MRIGSETVSCCSSSSGSSTTVSVVIAKARDEEGAIASLADSEYSEEGLRVLLLLLVGSCGVVCCASRGESASDMNDETSGGNAILLSRRSFVSDTVRGDGSSAADELAAAGAMVDAAGSGELCMDELGEGTWRVDLNLSSRSELFLRIGGASALSPSPTALELVDIFFECTGSSPAAARRWLARSRSERKRSMSATRVDPRDFSINFHSWVF